MSQLAVTGVTKSFGSTSVLRGLDLDVPAGALAAVLGPSGCGKTTLLRLVAGFDVPDAGTVTVGSRLLAGPGVCLAPERRRIGVVPQEGALFPHLTVAANVGFGLGRGTEWPDRRSRRSRVEEVLELVGLAGLGNRMPAELSGGQQQRVAVARALAPKPALVLLDEPFSALDTGLRAAVREDVRAALHATDATAVLVTHDQQEALSIADTVAVMRDGRVVQRGTPAEVYSDPADLEVARFVGEAVVLPAVVAAGRASTALGRLPLRTPAGDGEEGFVAVRPEQLVLRPAEESSAEEGSAEAGAVGPGEHGDDPAGIRAVVRHSTFFGHDALVTLDLAGEAVPDVVTARTHAVLVPAPGSRVRLTVREPVVFFAGPAGAS